MSQPPQATNRPIRILLKVLYWVAVLAVSIGILIALITFLESRDSSQVGSGARVAVPLLTP